MKKALFFIFVLIVAVMLYLGLTTAKSVKNSKHFEQIQKLAE